MLMHRGPRRPDETGRLLSRSIAPVIGCLIGLATATHATDTCVNYGDFMHWVDGAARTLTHWAARS